MCWRYDLPQNPAAIHAKFAVPEIPAFVPDADVCSTEYASIARLSRMEVCAGVLARWGLAPQLFRIEAAA